MTCRDEVLSAARELTKNSNTGEFRLEDILAYMERTGTSYKESTIRTHVTSRMCANSPDNHAVTYNDFIRTERGTYRIRSK